MPIRRQGFHPTGRAFIFNYAAHEAAQLPALLGNVLGGLLRVADARLAPKTSVFQPLQEG